MKSNVHFLIVNILICIFLSFFVGCIVQNNDKLDRAFRLAGKNQIELKKVLAHYKNDTLKLKAACFLIENMPQHYSLEIEQEDALEQLKIKSIKEDSLSKKDINHILAIQNKITSARKIYDCQVIKADYLIENIDFSFKVWQERPWAKYYSFDDFCRMILPYRIEHEPLESWKKEYYDCFAPDSWIPQAVTFIQKGKVSFKDIGTNLLYFLTVDDPSGLKVVGNPFVFDGKNIHYFNPELQHSDSAKLIRKTPLASRITAHLDNILDISIEYANDLSFKSSSLLYKITDTVRTNYNIIPVTFHNPFRYIYLLYNVPRNAILWLRDLTRGQEENLFIYKDGQQQFYL